LEAEKALRSTVSNASVEFALQTNLQLLENISWRTLRQEMRSQLGYRTDANANGLMTILVSLPQERRSDFQTRASTLAVAIARLDSVSPKQFNPFGLRNDTVNPQVEKLVRDFDDTRPSKPDARLSPKDILASAGKNVTSVSA